MTDVSANASQRASHAAEIALIEWLKSSIERGTLGAQATGQRHVDLKAKANPHDAEIGRIKADGRAAREEEAKAIGRKKEIAQDLKVAEIGVSVFSPAGVRAEILDTVTPFLNARTARYLSTLSDDNLSATWSTITFTAKGEPREKFAIEVASKSAGERFTSVSGGEKRKVRIAAALALQDLVASRASKPIELFIGDEIDAALDNAGLERLMSVLEEKARERGTVVVVSHQALRDWIPQVLTVTKRAGMASIAEERA